MKYSLILLLLIQALILNKLYSQDNTADSGNQTENLIQSQIALRKGSPVVFDGKTLFNIHSNIGPFSAQERAEIISSRLEKIKFDFNSDMLKIVVSEITTDIMYNDFIVMSITEPDAKEENLTPEQLAESYKEIIINAIIPVQKYSIVNNPHDLYDIIIENKTLLIKIAITVFAFIIVIVLIRFLFWLLEMLNSFIKTKLFKKVNSILINEKVILSKVNIIAMSNVFFNLVKFGFIIAFIYLYYYVLNLLYPSIKNSLLFDIIKGLLLTTVTLVIVFFIIKSLTNGIKFLSEKIDKWQGTIIKPLKIKNINILSDFQIIKLLKKLIVIIRIVITIAILYFAVPIIFSYFKFTNNWADILLGYIIKPINDIGKSFLLYIPNIFYIFVIIVISRFLINFTKDFFDQITAGELVFKGFSKDWARPTYKLVRGLLVVFAFIIIFPYLPGSDSDVFRGVSVFIGIVFSLGSTSIMANIVSGLVLTYTNAFRVGDRVRIGETIGDVVEKTLLVTRIETIKKVIITIPNSIVLNNHMINYTTSSNDAEGLILHTTVTLGYDIPWRKIHEILIAAALATENIKKDPKPFVLQTALNDFHVSYELNCYTAKPEIMATIYSALHQNIQDTCNEAGIEILSPAYSAIRDGNSKAIPEDYRSKEYKAPPFAVSIVDLLNKTGKKTNGEK